MELAFLRTTNFERWLPALLTGIFGQRRTTQTDDFSSGGGEEFFEGVHRRNCTPGELNPKPPALEQAAAMQ
jgi:hypothetical protein